MKYLIPSSLLGFHSKYEVFVPSSSFDFDGSSLVVDVVECGRFIGTLTFEVSDDENCNPVLSGSVSLDDAEYTVGGEASGYDLGAWFDTEDLPEELIDAVNAYLKDC